MSFLPSVRGYTAAVNERRLSTAELRRVRKLVRQLGSPAASTVPPIEALQLADSLRPGAGLTIDVEAVNELGVPVVILRVPSVSVRGTTFDGLTDREHAVAALLALGLRNREIGTRLGITVATTKDHVHNILEKSGLPNRAAVAAAYVTEPSERL